MHIYWAVKQCWLLWLCFHAVEWYYFKQRNIPVFSIGTPEDLFHVLQYFQGLQGEVSRDMQTKPHFFP